MERQISKRKAATAAKRARNPKMAARAQRNKQAIVRSPKDNSLHSAAANSVEPPPELHDDPKHQVPIIEPEADALVGDRSQRMTDSDPTKGFALPTANMQAYQAKLLEIAGANAQFAFEFSLRLATIRSPTEFLGVITEYQQTGRYVRAAFERTGRISVLADQAAREVTALPGR
ncbi:Phasin protein [Bradyrhizobium japonicum]